MLSLRLAVVGLLVAVGFALVASAASARDFPDFFADCPWWNANCRAMPLNMENPIPEPGAALLFAGGAIWVARRARAAR